MKKKTEKRNREPDIGVVLEHIDSKLDHVMEGQQGIQAQVEKVDERVGDLRTEMDYKFGVVFDELHLIRNELKEKIGRDEFVALEKRVLHLEKKTSGSSL